MEINLLSVFISGGIIKNLNVDYSLLSEQLYGHQNKEQFDKINEIFEQYDDERKVMALDLAVNYHPTYIDFTNELLRISLKS